MLGVFADNHYFAFSLNDFALFANLFYGWFNLHFITPTLSLLLCTPGYATLVEIVNRDLNGYAVTGQYSDIVHTKLSRYVCRYYMAVGKLYLEGCVRQCLYDCTFKFDNIILWQNNPSSAIISVTYSFNLPALIHKRSYHHTVGGKSAGIFVMRRQAVIPCFYGPLIGHFHNFLGADIYHRFDSKRHSRTKSRAPSCRSEVRHVGRLVQVVTYAVTYISFHHRKAVAFHSLLDSASDISYPVSCLILATPSKKL